MWYEFTDEYYQQMMGDCEKMVFYLQNKVTEQDRQQESDFTGMGSFVSTLNLENRSLKSIVKKKQKNSNFFSLKKRKPKGTIAPFFSCTSVSTTIGSIFFILALVLLMQIRIGGVREDHQFSLNLGQTSNFISDIQNEINLMISQMTDSEADYFGNNSIKLLKQRDSTFDKARNEVIQTILNHIKMTDKLEQNFEKIFIGNMCQEYGNLDSPLEFYPVFLDDCDTFLNGIMKNVSSLFSKLTNHLLIGLGPILSFRAFF